MPICRVYFQSDASLTKSSDYYDNGKNIILIEITDEDILKTSKKLQNKLTIASDQIPCYSITFKVFFNNDYYYTIYSLNPRFIQNNKNQKENP